MSRLTKQLRLFTLLLVSASALMIFASPKNAHAVTGSDWRAGNIIDDGVFYNNNDMSVADIQNFLNNKVTCDTWGTKPSEWGGGTRAQYGASKGYPAPYTCLKDYSQGGKSAAQIIKEAADTYRISAKSLIVLLQKEQALVTDEWPWPIQYRSATGYGCPDTAPCDAEYYGFKNQVMKAAYQFRRYATYPSEYRYKPYQNNTIQFNPNAGCGSNTVYIENLATAGLYNYTPYQPNASALNNLYGTGDGCGAYGNRNFWRLFNDWFGTVRATPYAWQYVTQYAYTDNTKVTSVDLNNATHGQRVYLGVQARNIGANTWTNSGANPVRIGTNNPQNRNSVFCDYTWLSCARPANLKEGSVAPGQIGTFEFWYDIPSSGGTSNEYFNLLAEGITWMNDLGLFYHTYAAPPTYTWQYVTQYSYTDIDKSTPVNLNQLTPGQRVFVGYQAKNTGNVNWTNSGTTPVGPGTSRPQDHNSLLCDSTWINCSRPVLMKESSVAPGQIGTFEFWIKSPYSPGDYREDFNNVTEGIRWMNDLGLHFNTTVLRPLLNSGASDRLTSNQQLSSNGSLNSSDKRYQLIMQSDGNLVIYSLQRAIWSSNTPGRPSSKLIMQSDGNLVIYDSQGRATWNSGTAGKGASTLVMQGDGNLVIYDSQGRATWNSGTSGRL